MGRSRDAEINAMMIEIPDRNGAPPAPARILDRCRLQIFPHHDSWTHC